MTPLECLEDFANKNNILIYKTFNDSCAICLNGRYAISLSKDLSISELTVSAAHELGHCETRTLYTIGNMDIIWAKCEYRANKWAIKKLIPWTSLQQAIDNGLTETWELAEYFCVTEDFIKKAVLYYKNCDVDN